MAKRIKMLAPAMTAREFQARVIGQSLADRDLREELTALDDDTLDTLCKSLGIGSIQRGTHVDAIVCWLSDNPVDYEVERGEFAANLATLRAEVGA